MNEVSFIGVLRGGGGQPGVHEIMKGGGNPTKGLGRSCGTKLARAAISHSPTKRKRVKEGLLLAREKAAAESTARCTTTCGRVLLTFPPLLSFQILIRWRVS